MFYLRFVKRINEAWSGSSPILVHCSAGVGRSGTLIAIDSLIQQLDEENEVRIYQMVCELRRDRNYLVQSVVSALFILIHTFTIAMVVNLHPYRVCRSSTCSSTEPSWRWPSSATPNTRLPS